MQYVLSDVGNPVPQLIVMSPGTRTPKQDTEIIEAVAKRHNTGAGIDWSSMSDELNTEYHFHIMGFRNISL